MHDLFKPRRRKIGLVTLGLACVFAAGWARSVQITDMYWLWVDSKIAHTWFSTAGEFIWRSEFYPNRLPPDVMNPGRWKRTAGQIAPTSIDDTTSFTTKWTWKLCAFKIKKAERYGITTYWIVIPYLFVSLPLTLLSAYLLLVKPRPAKKPEPAPTTGT